MQGEGEELKLADAWAQELEELEEEEEEDLTSDDPHETALHMMPRLLTDKAV